jgi:translation initiation factor eIF-2B subunit delta/methylthioribose-1-phosphate isomerase
MIPPVKTTLTQRLDELRSDREHGGSWMARRAVEALVEVAGEDVESSEELIENLVAAGRELASARPAMGAIAGAVGRVLAAAQVASYLPADELRRLFEEEARGLIGSRDRAARAIAIHLAPSLVDALVVTHSSSATVREAVTHTHPARVVCTVSAPFEEGRRFADELREAGLNVELVEDDDAAAALEHASLLLVGADTVFRNGSVVNKVGTQPLARAAAERGVRTVVACEVIKLAPMDAPERLPDGDFFDVTPAEDVDTIVTEEGAYGSDEIRALIDRTPFLRDGYRLLAAT